MRPIRTCAFTVSSAPFPCCRPVIGRQLAQPRPPGAMIGWRLEKKDVVAASIMDGVTQDAGEFYDGENEVSFRVPSWRLFPISKSWGGISKT